MSTFTSQSRSSGILSSEMPTLLFMKLKKYSFAKLKEWGNTENADWKGMLEAIKGWDEDTLASEKDEFVNYSPDAQSYLQFTILRAIKTKNRTKTNIVINESDLAKIDLGAFFHAYWKSLIGEDQLQTQDLFKGMSASDKNIVAQDAFREAVYAIAARIEAREKPSAVAAEGGQGVLPDDSVSRAPSEVISEYASRKSGLRGSIESLYKSTLKDTVASRRVVEETKSRGSARSGRTPVPSQFASKRGSVSASKRGSVLSRQSSSSRRVHPAAAPAAPPVEEEMVVDIPSEDGGSRAASKFSKSPPKKKKAENRFYDTEFSRLRDPSVASRLTTV